jgi:hypothetical protein
MGAKVSGFVKDVGKAMAKGATSFVLGKVPIVGNIAANWLNKQYKEGGRVVAFAEGGAVPAGVKTMAINTPAQLISLVKKVPELAQKHGLSPELIRQEVAKAKEGEVAVKARGGRMKKGLKGEDTVMVRAGHEPAHFARGGRVLSVF